MSRDPNSPNYRITVQRNLRRPWDTFFLPGWAQYDRRTDQFKSAARALGFELCIEYLRDTPAPGLSGVMMTRLPEGQSVPGGHRSDGMPMGGL